MTQASVSAHQSLRRPTPALTTLRAQRPLFEDGDAPLGLDEYQQFTVDTDNSPRAGVEGLPFALLGLFGETGSLLSELKKKQRDQDAYTAYRDSVLEELGDVLWYFANTARRAGVNLSVLAERAASKTLSGWSYQGRPNATTFLGLQSESEALTGPITGDSVERRLIALAARVGRLLDHFGSGRLLANGDAMSADLIEIFREILAAADDAKVSLDVAANGNVAKVLSRWPLKREWGAPFDSDFDEDERLPDKIEMTFKEKKVGDRAYVLQKCRGIIVGDRLTDNHPTPDDYRFHDVFHLAYATFLGWSPVLRALLRLKRKSQPEIDEAQDGARAILIEEGVSTWIFNHATTLKDFRNVPRLDYGLLKAVRQLVKGYEVQSRPLWQWEQAILEGYAVFRKLRAARGGIVTANLRNHTLTFERE
jgi:NTP pyrophosphatase (non-canonical NTP hydrolase)